MGICPCFLVSVGERRSDTFNHTGHYCYYHHKPLQSELEGSSKDYKTTQGVLK